MEREKVLSVGPPGPGASIYLLGQVQCWSHAHFLVLIMLHSQEYSVCLILIIDTKRFMIVSHFCCCSLIPLHESLCGDWSCLFWVWVCPPIRNLCVYFIRNPELSFCLPECLSNREPSLHLLLWLVRCLHVWWAPCSLPPSLPSILSGLFLSKSHTHSQNITQKALL